MKSANAPKAPQILAVARELIGAGGYNSFSYADLSATVGITKASIHHHFPTKEALVKEVVRQYRAEGQEALAALDASGLSPRERLAAYTGYWEQCVRDNVASFCVCAMLAAEVSQIPVDVRAEVTAHFKELLKWLTRTLEAGVKAGQFELASPAKAEALTLMSTVNGAMLSARAFGDPSVFAAIVQAAAGRIDLGRAKPG